jgi:polyisoprenyl-phosphate glycosyltransferase
MILGSDVSSLTTSAANAAAQGLSIVVPLYNEAAGLVRLHERLATLAMSSWYRCRATSARKRP